jgi:hypothetical protein
MSQQQFSTIQSYDSSIPGPFQSLLNRIQANISQAFAALSSPFLGGQLIQNVSVGTTATVINHGLGRQPQIWTLCDQQANAIVWRTAWNSNSITLQATAACTLSLWVN